MELLGNITNVAYWRKTITGYDLILILQNMEFQLMKINYFMMLERPMEQYQRLIKF